MTNDFLKKSKIKGTSEAIASAKEATVSCIEREATTCVEKAEVRVFGLETDIVLGCRSL